MKQLFFFLGLCFVLWSPTFAQNADTSWIRKHLTTLTKPETRFRNFRDTITLNQAAQYIKDIFLLYADTVFEQPYKVRGVTYKNVIASFSTHQTKRIIIGAHYDVCGNQPGADDNASGVAGVLELARMLKDRKSDYRIDLVAYTLEEPPFFWTQNMGSYIHAKSLFLEKANVEGMISLEMIGYFKEEKKTQTYPLKILRLFYGNRGNYIAIMTKINKGRFARKFSRKMLKNKQLRIRKVAAPKRLPVADRSDQRCYWDFGYSAFMINNTARYRNVEYHQPGDVMEHLDFVKMAAVINSVFLALEDY